jgi:thiamine biosynthesis lipoprotein
MGADSRSRLAPLPTALTLAVACVAAPNAVPGETVVRDVYLMGTRALLVTSAADRVTGLATLDRALGILESAEAELSTWRDDSIVSRLNRQPVHSAFVIPHELCDTFAVLYTWHAATAGTFDPAIGRLTDAWGIHADGRVPPEPVLRLARATSGLDLLDFDATRCEVTRRADAWLDVGAFGKGDALDRVERGLGGASWMIDLGGQVSVHGTPAGAQAWQVAIAHPRDRERAWLHVALTKGSLATSGGSERDAIVDGRRVGHILDPRTGEPAGFEGSVSVWHRRGVVADILSTALYVMGPAEGLAFAERRGIAACYLVAVADGTVRMLATSPFRQLIT